MAVGEKQGKPPIVLPRTITVTVGVHGDAGAVTHGSATHAANDTRPGAANDTGAVEKKPLTVADIATFNEFGTSRIPQRSFIRAWFDESQDFIKETLTSQMKLVIAGKLTAEKAGARIALAFEGSVKQRISRGILPKNADSTIARKGSSKPLIDKGQLRTAIRGRAVFDEAGAELGTDVAAE